MTNDKIPTIFESVGEKERKEAIKNLLAGRTPAKEIRQRDARGGGTVNYVNTYYMTRQMSLITGYRWSAEYLEDRARPEWDNPTEVGVRVKVTYWDTDGNSFSQTAWGQKDVARYRQDGKNYKGGDIISIFDDLKAAESDAIKKALSYFGIASDIYGGKEMEFFEDSPAEDSRATIQTDSNSKVLTTKLSKHNILASEAFKILGVNKLSEVTDFKEAWDKIKKAKEIEE